MNAALLVLDLIRSHYRGDDQAFRAHALTLARGTKDQDTRKSMLDVLEQGKRRPAPYRPPTYSQPAIPDSRFKQVAALPPPSPLKPKSHSSLIEPLPEFLLDDLLLDDAIRAQVDELVLELTYRPDFVTAGLRPRCRLLFEGVPGVGKSSLGAAMADELGIQAYGVTIPSLISKFVGATGENLGELFKYVDDDCVIVFDEIDAIGSGRIGVQSSAGAEHNAIVNTILTLLDRNTRGTLIATTNRVDILDPALIRRFDETITFPAPTRELMGVLAGRLEERYKLPPVDLSGCENYDAVTKRVLREARRAIMAKILAAKAATDDLDAIEDGKEGEDNGGRPEA